MRIYTFRLKSSENQRPMLLSIPASKIEKIESQVGSQEVFCKVNGIEVDASYNAVIAQLEND